MSLAQIIFETSAKITKIGENTFYRCTSLRKITIPPSVTSIGDLAFFSCTSLAQITIPSSITFFGKDVFYECSSVSYLSFGSLIITGTHINVTSIVTQLIENANIR